MTTKTEAIHPGEFILSEEEGYRSRDKGTLITGQNLVAGAVLGKITLAGATTAFTGTGNGGITMDATTPVLNGAVPGDYTATMVDYVTNGGAWSIVDPNGHAVGVAYTGQTFANQIKFVIADGGTDYANGDKYTITVAAGSGKYTAVPATTANDGSSVAAGVLYEATNATSADKPITVITRAAEVDGNLLTYSTTSLTGLTSTQLASLGVVVRT